MNRRGFLGAILAAGVAPAIVRASSLMKIAAPLGYVSAVGGNTLITPEAIAREALFILREKLDFSCLVSSDLGLSYQQEERIVIKHLNRMFSVAQ